MPLSHSEIDAIGRDALQRAAAGDFSGAEPLLAEVVAARPNSGQALHLLGQVRLKLGRYVEAREPLERGARFLPKDAAAQINLAGCLTMLGEHAAALAALERAARLKPGDATIAHNQGRALEALGRLEEAERCHDEALSIDHRLLPSLSARAGLLARRGDWMGALADLERALTERPHDARLRLRRGELLLRQGDWLRGLPDLEARLELPGARYAPDLPPWQGEPLAGKLLLYPEQAEIESDAALRDTLLLARGVDAVVQCAARIAPWIGLPTIARGEALDGFAAAAPLRGLPFLLGWTPNAIPPVVAARREPGDRIGWFADIEPPGGIDVERDPERVAGCRLVVGEDRAITHLAARRGIRTLMLLGEDADWVWGSTAWYPAIEVLRPHQLGTLARRL